MRDEIQRFEPGTNEKLKMKNEKLSIRQPQDSEFIEGQLKSKNFLASIGNAISKYQKLLYAVFSGLLRKFISEEQEIPKKIFFINYKAHKINYKLLIILSH